MGFVPLPSVPTDRQDSAVKHQQKKHSLRRTSIVSKFWNFILESFARTSQKIAGLHGRPTRISFAERNNP